MPHSPIGVRRVVLVVLDGLRPDAIEAFNLSNIQRLAAQGASTMSGATVSPSVTAACMASLLTGVAPEHHGLCSDRFHVPRRRAHEESLPRVLAEVSLPTTAFMCRVPLLMRWVARRLARRLGIVPAHLHGVGATDVLGAALGALERQRDGLIVLHWPDCDDAGHEHGWMTPPYADAARRLDRALEVLVERSGVPGDPSTLLVALADHGGGGAVLTNHDSSHPLDRTIPIIFAGDAVEPGPLSPPTHLLDIPATVLWALGARLPASYRGRPLTEAFGVVTAPLLDGRRGATVHAHLHGNSSWSS
jgi:predicted AlkP superfamily pyrophosphatase or phosphodiesterase